MEKLHIWQLLLLLITWISLSSQRPTALDQPLSLIITRNENHTPQLDNDNDNDNDNSNDNEMLSMWMSTFDYPQRLTDYPPDKDVDLRDDLRDDVWTSAAWMKTMQTQTQQKRGFSMLTRWKPFNSMSKQRTSIRNINRAMYAPSHAAAAAAAANDFEMVSAETRALSRPSGQPLRWG